MEFDEISFDEIFVDDETAMALEKIIGVDSDDFYELAVAGQVVPSDLETFLAEEGMDTLFPGNKKIKNDLANHRKLVTSYIQAVKADKRPYIDIEQQLEVYWNAEVEPKENYTYNA